MSEHRIQVDINGQAVTAQVEPEEPVVTLDDAKRGARVHPDVETNVAAVVAFPRQQDPEIEKILASAPHRVTRTIKHQRISHSPLETRGVVVSSHGQGELTIYIGCQSPQIVARYLSLAFGGGRAGVRRHPHRHAFEERRGLQGRGRGSNIIGPPTLVNAIADALAPFGELPLELPWTPAKILKLIEGAAAEAN